MGGTGNAACIIARRNVIVSTAGAGYPWPVISPEREREKKIKTPKIYIVACLSVPPSLLAPIEDPRPFKYSLSRTDSAVTSRPRDRRLVPALYLQLC